MRANRYLTLAAGLWALMLATAPLEAGAQMRTGGGRAATLHARPAAARPLATRAAGVRRAVPLARTAVRFNPLTNSFETNNGSSVALQQLIDPFPGPGFSFRHLALMNQDLGVKALIDPATQWRLAEARRFRRGSRFAGPGFFIWDPGAYYPYTDDSSAASEPATSDESAEQAQQGPEQAAYPEASGENASAEQQPPLPDVGEFTLVLQNGKQLEAVAFTRVNDQIVYITLDGSRRTIAAADLNSDATVRINGERGTPLQLPL